MRAWHVDDALAAAYAAGSAPEPDAWSLEKHVESCGACAVRVSAAVRRGAAGPVLAEVRAAVLTAAAGPSVRPSAPPLPSVPAARPTPRVGAPRTGLVARVLWAAGPALRGSWLVALVLVAAGAVGLAYGAGFAGARPLLLALAPVLPLAGVAVSYGQHVDPMYEIGASSPGGGLRLLLTRTTAVLAVSLPLLTLTGAVLPASAEVPGAAAWLLPGLALTLAALVLGSYVGCRTAAGAVAAVWAGALAVPVLGTARQGDAVAVSPLPVAELSTYLARFLDGAAAQGGWGAGAAVCAGLLVLRRRSFDHPDFGAPGRV
ncbi:zf-HC2 domain-containing protein [Streptomyces sp. GMY02]|uniref:zf-HC2 domain-containing protein n=1 Tax=Streptomyces sp. GMY02 TaxID=1333528 RepID=UPI001C2CC4FB|nr:zf-HC2 domain-containing protein [Streptomyces sp. GMY02]QXE39046.1 zf-HC2 domain-containing protein [Streptomyces sp. GMY02]